ncbi:FHA domain-containing protein [Singulisphaera rosea]
MEDRPRRPDFAEERSGTLIETDEDLRQALLSGLQPRAQAQAQGSVPPPIMTIAPTAPSIGAPPAHLFRPTARPPMPILTVYDDGKLDGEVIRIRDRRFVIGRTEGDLRIPIDGRISSRHVEITLQTVAGVHRWVVTDLQSLHGMFVRVSRTVIADKAEFLVGNGRYRFDAPPSVSDATVDQLGDGSFSGQTHGWNEGTNPLRTSALTEVIGNEIGNRLLLVKPEYWIGSDPSCPVVRTDDPFCEPRHVRLSRNAKGVWNAEHNRTQNGLWLRLSQIVVDKVIQFQIGEQRFRLKIS